MKEFKLVTRVTLTAIEPRKLSAWVVPLRSKGGGDDYVGQGDHKHWGPLNTPSSNAGVCV